VHMLYYTIVVGGDYFEYRVYSYLIPLLFLSFVWMLNRLEFSSVVSFSTLALFVALSLPIPWAHWYKTHNLYSRDETLKMVAPVADVFRETAPSLPGFVVEYVAYYDSLQEWLINHYVGIRHQELKALWIRLDVLFPSREAGSSVDGEYPVIAQQAVGVIGWVLPHVNIIDLYGLNDYVIARNPELRPSLRMAHLRMPPPGYVDCFQPNVRVKSKQILVTARPRPLTAETIAFCERYYLDLELAPINNPP